jgi:hypothetical protein
MVNSASCPAAGRTGNSLPMRTLSTERPGNHEVRVCPERSREEGHEENTKYVGWVLNPRGNLEKDASVLYLSFLTALRQSFLLDT